MDGGPPPPMGQPVHPSGTTLPDAGAKALPGNRYLLPILIYTLKNFKVTLKRVTASLCKWFYLDPTERDNKIYKR